MLNAANFARVQAAKGRKLLSLTRPLQPFRSEVATHRLHWLHHGRRAKQPVTLAKRGEDFIPVITR